MKGPLLLMYLQDHANYVCNRLNDNRASKICSSEDNDQQWEVCGLSESQRRNFLFYFGWCEDFVR